MRVESYKTDNRFGVKQRHTWSKCVDSLIETELKDTLLTGAKSDVMLVSNLK